MWWMTEGGRNEVLLAMYYFDTVVSTRPVYNGVFRCGCIDFVRVMMIVDIWMYCITYLHYLSAPDVNG